MDRLNIAGTDAVADALNTLRVHSSVYCLSELRAPWGFAVDDSQAAKFHLVLEGKCSLHLAEREPVLLRDGDLVVLPHGTGHAIRDDEDSPVVSLDSLIAAYPLDARARLSNGGVGSRTRLLCGGFAVSGSSLPRILDSLPPVVHLDSGDTRSWLEPLVTLVRREADRTEAGSQAIFAKLADLLLSQALRTHLTRASWQGWPGKTCDGRVEQAARLLERHSGRTWTLQQLAREVGMSRTSLAAEFRAATGDSPMRHLARIRLTQAAGYLVTADLSVEAIARRTGYSSSASLSKAFKREFGVSPGQYRVSGY